MKSLTQRTIKIKLLLKKKVGKNNKEKTGNNSFFSQNFREFIQTMNTTIDFSSLFFIIYDKLYFLTFEFFSDRLLKLVKKEKYVLKLGSIGQWKDVAYLI